jgi:hypothetical protein
MGNNENDPDEGPRDLSEMALSPLDRDLDGRVSLEYFLQSVQNDYLLMEIFESCLPSGARAAAVLAVLSRNGTLPISVPPLLREVVIRLHDKMSCSFFCTVYLPISPVEVITSIGTLLS